MLDFETFELGNSDICDTILDLWGVNVLPDNQQDFDEFLDNMENEEITSALQQKFLDNCNDFLVSKFGHAHLYCLWLTTLEGVTKLYTQEGGTVECKRYVFPEQATIIPISDLGLDGALFVTDIHPDWGWKTELIFEE